MKFPQSAASARLLKQLADFNPSGKEDSAPNGTVLCACYYVTPRGGLPGYHWSVSDVQMLRSLATERARSQGAWDQLALANRQQWFGHAWRALRHGYI